MGAVPSQPLTGKDITGPSQNNMKAFVAVFAGVAAASAAPEADPYLLAHPVYLDPHATSGETVELPTGEVVPDTTNAVKLATADHLLAKALHTPWLWHYGKREAEAEADPWLLAHPVLLDPHASSGETVELPNGAVVPDETNSVKLAKADHLLAKALHTPLWWHYGKREAEADAEADAEAETKPYYGLGYGNGLGLGYGYGYLGKRSAEAEAKPYYGVYGYGVAPYAVVPEIEPKATGFIVSPASGAVTPDFTAEQKEANPEIAEGSKSIDVPVVTGFTHYLGKREAEPYYYGGLGYGYGGLGYGLAAPILPAPVELNCKNAWGWPVLCAQEGEADAAPAEEAAKEKRSADAQLYLGGLAPWGLPGPLVHSSLLGVCTNDNGEQVPC